MGLLKHQSVMYYYIRLLLKLKHWRHYDKEKYQQIPLSNVFGPIVKTTTV